MISLNNFDNPLSVQSHSLVSVHGGHSGEYCQHAQDCLEDIVKAYLDRNFSWVGITEHMPPTEDKFLYPDERSSGLTAFDIQNHFTRYVTHCRKLQSTYRGKLTIFVGMETEAYQGAFDYALDLQNRFKPDYIVGSVHHILDIPFDLNSIEYSRAVMRCGNILNLYTNYFDLQYEMIHRLKPNVVGHFDLIRIFDPNYPVHLKTPEIWERICRNLRSIAALGLILDINFRSLLKGAHEPYPSHPILEKARDMGIMVLPGDDSHSIDTAGANIEEGIRYIHSLGLSILEKLPIN